MWKLSFVRPEVVLFFFLFKWTTAIFLTPLLCCSCLPFTEPDLCKNKLTHDEQLACKVNKIQQLSRLWSQCARLHDVPVVHMAGCAYTYSSMFPPCFPCVQLTAWWLRIRRCKFCVLMPRLASSTLQGSITRWHANGSSRLKCTNRVSCLLGVALTWQFESPDRAWPLCFPPQKWLSWTGTRRGSHPKDDMPRGTLFRYRIFPKTWLTGCEAVRSAECLQRNVGFVINGKRSWCLTLCCALVLNLPFFCLPPAASLLWTISSFFFLSFSFSYSLSLLPDILYNLFLSLFPLTSFSPLLISSSLFFLYPLLSLALFPHLSLFPPVFLVPLVFLAYPSLFPLIFLFPLLSSPCFLSSP